MSQNATTRQATTTLDAAVERPTTLAELKASGYQPKSVKQEVCDNLMRALQDKSPLFEGIVGYENTVIPEIVLALLAQHDMLFLGEKGQGKSRMMRGLVQFLDDAVPYIDAPGLAVHEDPMAPITSQGKKLVADTPEDELKIAWWPRAERYAERLAPGTKFADVIGEIDPAKLIGGVSMSSEEALHFGLIPRMHRGIFAMNELPELDELVQVGLFNLLEERDVQIRGYPISFDVDVLVLFSANPSTYNRSGKVIPQLKDRIGSIIHTHYPKERELGIQIMEQEAAIALAGPLPVVVPYFMKELIEQVTVQARKSRYIDHDSGVSARFSIANYSTVIASARRRGALLGESPAVPRISDLGHLAASALGKLELDMMGSSQMSEQQVLDAIVAEAIEAVFDEYIDQLGLDAIADVFAKGVKIEVGDLMPSATYEKVLARVPEAWEKAFEINPASDPAVRASCVEFVLAGLYANQQISRVERHGQVTYEV